MSDLLRVSAREMFASASQNISSCIVLKLLLNEMFPIQKRTLTDSKLRTSRGRSTEMNSSPLTVTVLREYCSFVCFLFY